MDENSFVGVDGDQTKTNLEWIQVWIEDKEMKSASIRHLVHEGYKVPEKHSCRRRT